MRQQSSRGRAYKRAMLQRAKAKARAKMARGYAWNSNSPEAFSSPYKPTPRQIGIQAVMHNTCPCGMCTSKDKTHRNERHRVFQVALKEARLEDVALVHELMLEKSPVQVELSLGDVNDGEHDDFQDSYSFDDDFYEAPPFRESFSTRWTDMHGTTGFWWEHSRLATAPARDIWSLFQNRFDDDNGYWIGRYLRALLVWEFDRWEAAVHAPDATHVEGFTFDETHTLDQLQRLLEVLVKVSD